MSACVSGVGIIIIIIMCEVKSVNIACLFVVAA